MRRQPGNRKMLKVAIAALFLLTAFGAGKQKMVYAEEVMQSNENQSNDGTFFYTSDGELKGISADFTGKSLAIPGSIDGTVITAIGDGCFKGQATLCTITLPDSVTTIGVQAFAQMTFIDEITIPSTVIQVGERAFSGSGIRWVTIQADSKAFDKGTFSGCKYLERVTFSFSDGGHWQKVPSQMFSGCTSLKSITLPEGVSKIETEAFSGSGLQSVGLPSTTKTISERAFKGSALASVQFPQSLRRIGEEAFAETELGSVSWPGTVSTIPDSVFSGCSSLLEIVIPKSVTVIGEWAFDTSGTANVYNASGEAITGADSKRAVDAQFLMGHTVLNVYAALNAEASLQEKIVIDGQQLVNGGIHYYREDVSVMPSPGYALQTLWLNGTAVDVSGEGARFAMPTSAATLTGSVSALPSGGTGGSDSPNGGTGGSDSPSGGTGGSDSPNGGTGGSDSPNGGTGGSDSSNGGTGESGSSNGDSGNSPGTENTVLKKGSKIKDKSSKAVYKVTKTSGTRKVEYVSSTEKKPKTIKIPSQIKANGKTYQVTSIGASAFYKSKELKSVTIPKNVTNIGKRAFYGAKKLKTVEIKSTTLKSVGKQAFEGIDKKAQFKVPKKYYSRYQKLLKGKGIKSSMKWKKK